MATDCGELVALRINLDHGERSPPVRGGRPLDQKRVAVAIPWAKSGPGEGGETFPRSTEKPECEAPVAPQPDRGFLMTQTGPLCCFRVTALLLEMH